MSVRGVVLGIVLATALGTLVLASRPAMAQSPPAGPPARQRVTLKLTDGSAIVGTIVARSGGNIVVVADDGRTRTVAGGAIASTAALPATDRVILDDGTTLEGKVTELRAGESVTITKADRSQQIVRWEHVRDVVVRLEGAAIPAAAAGLVAAAAAGGTVTTTTTIRADASGASLDLTRECAASPDSPRCKEHTNVAVGPGGPRASYESEDASGRKSARIDTSGAHAQLERDCAANPDDERCTERGGLDLGSGGISAGYSPDKVTRVKTPPSSVTNVSLDIGAGFALSTGGQLKGAKIFFLPIDLTIPILVGGRFPNENGGSWLGIKIEPTAGALLIAMSLPEPVSGTGTLFGYRLGGTLAAQYLSFGAMTKGSFKQRGFGLALGAFVGVQGQTGSISTSICTRFGCQSQSVDVSSRSATYGPSLSLTFPQYNAGTAKYSAINANIMVLPTGDTTIFFATFGASF